MTPTPQEEAKLLFAQMYNATDSLGKYPMCFDTAKQCAAKAALAIMKLHKKLPLETLKHYAEVITEIEKL